MPNPIILGKYLHITNITFIQALHCNIRSKIVLSLLTSSVVISNCDQHKSIKSMINLYSAAHDLAAISIPHWVCGARGH